MKLTQQQRQEFLGALFLWCFKWGCEVRLQNRALNIPIPEPFRLIADNTFLDYSHRVKHKVMEIPEIIFSKDGRCVQIYGTDWDDLLRAIEARQKYIYTELSIPMANFPTLNTTT
jgi:hypothetical protein